MYQSSCKLLLSTWKILSVPGDVYLAGIYLLKVNIRNARRRCEICSKLIIKTAEWRHWRRSGVFIINFEDISHLVLVFILLNLNMQLPAG